MRKLIVADGVRTPAGLVGDAVLVEGTRIAAVGVASDLRSLGIHEERYPGATIIPGLRDAHIHPVPYTALLSGVQLKDADSIRDIQDRIRAAAAIGPVIAMRLDDESLAERRLPTRWELDAAVSDRPVLVHRYCGHVAVANSRALEAAGVGATTPDPEGGSIDRDDEGLPTGVLRETAIELVSTRLDVSSSVDPPTLLSALRGLAGLGLTSIGAMLGLGDGPWASLGDEVELFADAGPLPIRVHGFVIAADPQRIDDAARRLRRGGGANLRFAGVKRFADGSLGGHTASMHDPFADDPEERGTLRLTAYDEAAVRHVIDGGAMAAVHAIGDRAVAAVLDLFGRLISDGADPRRLRIEHASVLAEADIGRLGAMGVVASVQPAFLGSETTWLERRVGRDRLQRTYPFRSLEAVGAVLAGGSDSPVEPPHPLLGMALARDRAGIVPGEGISPESALAMFTSGGAISLGESEPLAVGSAADLIVLDRDPVTATPTEVRLTEVLDTYVNGTAVPIDRSLPTWPTVI